MIDQDLLTALQYAVLEPPNAGASWPSGLWSRDEVLSALNQRQDRLLKESLLIVNTATIPVLLADIGLRRFPLPTDWLGTLSLVWAGDDGTIRELLRSDSFEADHGLPEWTSPGAPLVYMDYDASHLEVQIGPAPSGTGFFDLLYVPTGVPLTGNGVSLTVPDELDTALKYGALADLLGKDGRGQDLARSLYGATRYQMAVEAAKLILEGLA